MALTGCGGVERPAPIRVLVSPAPWPKPSPVLAGPSPVVKTAPPEALAEAAPGSPVEPVPEPPAERVEVGRCAGVQALGPEGEVPPAPPHLSLGLDVEVPGDRPAYVLPGDAGDSRVIVYLHGMCGDIAAADYFREAVRQHGTLLALRGDTPCAGERFKWRDDPPQVLRRLRTALQAVNAHNGSALSLSGALLFGYSQGADRAEKLAAEYPKIFPRVVLGGPPMRASPLKLGRATRVAILGGELETTETMHAGADALIAAGIACRFFTLECAYHGYYGIRAEQQLAEVLDWVSGQ